MYSRFLPPEDAFHPLPPEEEASNTAVPPPQSARSAQSTRSAHPAQPPRPGGPQNVSPPASKGPAGELLGTFTQELNRLLGGLFHFSLEDLDSGDILLILIVLFLFLEGDDLDLAIALGLTLLLSLGDSNPDPTPPPDAEPYRQAE